MKKNLKYNLTWLAIAVILYVGLFALYNGGFINLYTDAIIANIGINVILAVGLNLIIGFSGQFSLGHAGFMAIGAYAAAIITRDDPTFGGFFKGLLVGMVISGIVALVVGIPTLRLKGDYLAIATLGISEIIRILIVNLDEVTNGPAGIFGLPQFSNWQVIFIAMVVSVLVVSNFIHSGSGRATLAIREDEIAAESMGVNTTKYKVIAFVMGAVLASVAGTLFASYQQSVFPQDYGFMKSIDVLIIVVFGGIGSTTGAIVSAAVLGFLNMYLQDFGNLRMIIYALAIIGIMIFKPSGLLGSWEFSVKRIFDKFSKKGDDSDASINS
ncbi:branched-chain amino acid ABC transporter permease [Enterococcus saccharolyticus]|uniref:branched-chain amino acid ABC transporter permease n=1 Tax=Enterococcus saccharolyticus TaxID=41997 RepID=UPI001E4AD105|nr:branched-chain amino acid ABC transporter permease [Enterococcus saccharolyticus]MCD5002765.1 branched-chain amino acid ABC transporter permease [Enterococcus saccharolyticus]